LGKAECAALFSPSLLRSSSLPSSRTFSLRTGSHPQLFIGLSGMRRVFLWLRYPSRSCGRIWCYVFDITTGALALHFVYEIFRALRARRITLVSRYAVVFHPCANGE
jgi:hypothetical protein